MVKLAELNPSISTSHILQKLIISYKAYYLYVLVHIIFMFLCILSYVWQVALSAFDKKADLDVLDHPILNLIYYMVSELFSSVW